VLETLVDVPGQLRDQRLGAAARLVVTTGGVDPDAVGHFAGAEPVGHQLRQRLVLQFRGKVPHGRVHGADGDAAVTVAAGLLALEHHGVHPNGIQVSGRRVEQHLGLGLHHTGDRAVADDLALGVATR
jgi:hypothetical protein